MNNVISDDHRRILTLATTMALNVVAGLLLAEASQAQQWVLQPEARVGYEVDDNARLSSDPDLVQEIDGFILEGSLGIGYNTQRTTFELTPRLRSRIYDETPDVDSNDQFLEFDFGHETLKGQFGIDASYERESVRTGERADPDFDVDDPDEIPTDETGFVFNNERRERLRFSPDWSYDLTERLTMGLRAVYLDVSYDDALTSFLVDYTDTRLEGSLGLELTERTRGYFGVGARRYESDQDNNDVDGLGAAIGVESDISQTTRLQAEIGYENTEQVATGETDGSFVANLNLVRRLETITMLAQYRRNVAASGAGRVSARDSVNFTVSKQFSERVTGALGVRAYQTEPVGEHAVTFEERDFTELRATLGYAISRAFSIEGDYRHARIDRSGQEGSADSNSIILWLVYRPTEIIR
jgi:Putative beta-barrel porin 2